MKRKTMEFDPRLKHPFTGMVVGPTQCGKTTLVLNLIERADEAIVPPPERFIWCYDKFPPVVDHIDKEIKFVDGLPDVEDLRDDSKRSLIVIEDLMSETDQSVSKLFTKGSHHRNISVIYVSQNLYSKNKENRTISLNTHYLVLFKNPRDASQITCLGRQIYPNDSKHFHEAFDDATQQPHNYLLMDFKQSTPEECRLRASVFPDSGLAVYVKKYK